MSSSLRSKLPLLLYGILVCSSFVLLPVFSSKRPSIRSGGLLVRASGSSWDKREVTARDGEYLLGIKRLRRLYCNVGIGFHIQVLPNGKITGVHNENRYSLLEMSPVERGVLTLFGVRSGLFIAMSDKGKLYGSGHYSDECKFKETLLANNYNAYESAAYPGMYIGLSKTGKTKRGNRGHTHHDRDTLPSQDINLRAKLSAGQNKIKTTSWSDLTVGPLLLSFYN